MKEIRKPGDPSFPEHTTFPVRAIWIGNKGVKFGACSHDSLGYGQTGLLSRKPRQSSQDISHYYYFTPDGCEMFQLLYLELPGVIGSSDYTTIYISK